ncbi:MAG TPA: winged helix-turn-helix domain-containing protein [Vicinamibacterales bacterium]
MVDSPARVVVMDTQFCFGPFRVDPGTRQLWRDDRLVPLNTRVFETLLVLVRHRDRVVEKDELLKAVWPDSFVSEDSLTQSVWALRRALGDDSSQPTFVATVPRRGYRFVAAVGPGDSAPLPAASASPDPASPTQGPADASDPQLPAASEGATARRPRPSAWVWAAAAVAAVAVVAVAGVVAFSRTPEAPAGAVVRTPVQAPPGTSIVAGAVVSPDSQYLALVSQDHETGTIQLWVRTLETGETRVVAGTEGAARPFWNPTSTALGFFANGRLKTVALTGDGPRTLAGVGLNPGGGSWGPDGVILFAGSRTGLMTVAETGGRVTPVTTLDAGQRDRAHRWPAFLPDGRRFIFTVVSNDPERAGTYLGTLGGGVPTRLFDVPTAFATYVPSGHILYVRDLALMAQAFDPESATLRGAPVGVATHVAAPDFLNGAYVSGSAAGLLTFGGGWRGGRLAWFDRKGGRLGEVETPTWLHNPTLSDDGRHLLADPSGEANPEFQGVWRIDLEEGTRHRLLRGGIGLWSPDAQQVAFSTGEGGISDLFLTPASGQTERHALLKTAESKGLNDWSGDGRYLVFISTNPQTKSDLWLLPLTGDDRQPVPYLRTPFEELQGQVSPDGRWLAYTSDESGRWEVYVQSFPTPGTKYVVSAGGGGEPQWRADGRELFYMALDHTLKSVAVESTSPWRNGRPVPLFRAQVAGDLTRYRTRYQTADNGQRFLLDSVVEDGSQEVTLVVNWPALARR